MNASGTDGPWRPGNRVRLLENGEEFFARAFEVIAQAKREILLETFILFEDQVGVELQRRLIAAAQRGVSVDVMVDGYGSPSFSPEYLGDLAAAGVRLRVFDPRPTLLGMRLHVFRRMHRKLLIADGERAFVGGINYSADHLSDFGPDSKQDYAIELEGPIVADIHDFVSTTIRAHDGGESWTHPADPPQTAAAGDAEALFLVRDNGHHSTTIERRYRAAIRAARHEIVIANAYFFPGYAFLRELRHAAMRGVRVSLIVQGEPDMPIARSAARMLYGDLIAAGASIHEYCRRPFHGKVALVDDDWATVGSSNLDPLSLSLNLEANVFIMDRAFNRHLRQRLEDLRQRHCRLVEPEALPERSFWRTASAPLLYHVLRRFPAWAGLLPAHTPKVVLVAPRAAEADSNARPG
jgi:cardiolipin synthase